MAPQMPHAGTMSTNTIGRPTRADYNKEALHQIRASLLPYAAGGIPRERLSPISPGAQCQGSFNLGPSEEDIQKTYNGYPKPTHQVEGSKIIRKSSFDRELNLHRGSPALESSNASTRSDSPGIGGQIYYANSMPVRQYAECPQPRLGSGEPLVGDLNHAAVSRQYSNSYPIAPEAPPPPPPRSQGATAPPPTPPRGTTPPPPPYPCATSCAPTIVTTIGQRPLLLSRLSPGPSKNKSQANYVNINNVSQSSTPQRGTSPVSFGGRQPVVVQSSQVQQQLSHQMQALSINNSNNYGNQLDRPPPYPVGSALKHVGAVKLAAPPPSYNATMQNRQSPTQDCRRSPPQLTFQGQNPIMTPHPVSPSSLSPPSSMSPVSLPRGGQTARQAKTPTPIIMQSVKSTQVQKPILQTAAAPTSPPVSAPPPSYASSIQQKQAQAAAVAQDVPSIALAQMMSQDSGGSSSPGLSCNYQLAVTCNSGAVPTTDPPSYHSTIQAMAAAAARGYSPGYLSQPVASIPVQETPVQELDLSSTPLAHIPITQVSTVDSIITTHPASGVETVSSCYDPHLTHISHPPLQRKFSPVMADTASIASRSESPVSSVNSHDTHALSQSPVSCLSTATSSPSTQSDLTLESGYSSGQSCRGIPPPPPPIVQKTTHHSPIPERKKLSTEMELQRCESKVRNLSPQAFKFYMEQHIENVIKSCEERENRRMQLEKEMKKIGLSDKDQSQMRKMLSQKESNFIRLKRAKMDKQLFRKVKTIGVGAFGEVALVCKIDTHRLYAMKTLRKADVLKRNQVAHVKAERDILAEADNEWVVKLYYSFQDKDNLYFVMDYIPGGDLMSLLIKFGIFEEKLARFYIGELVCAIESVHKMGFIHRDIKPDNILIDRDGHIKLTDFGLCTGFRWTHNSKYYQRVGDHNRQDSIDPCGDNDIVCHCNDLKPLERRRRRQHLRCLAHSLVGTPNYIAPEVLSRTGYTQLCDWWSVGVILYEMLVGQPPFLANTPPETQYKVINWETTLRIPKQAKLSSEAKDLILNLCTHPEQRLGRNGAQEVKSHPFLESLDFEGGLRKQQALYLPKIKHPTDTSNFDPIDPDKLRPSEPNESDIEWVNNSNQPLHAFFEFTFRRFFDSTPGGSGNDEKDSQHPVYV
nr:serine/threonine-protein kinase Warts-like [Procambarus clarkii]XP_045614889.1 serine/threonine-protein kinase Warts-like [Procambarus clarkii]XP_045614890.1 serine/threonine-protein kinase Warts-like [Procambarus clarkii]XP_045614891.1 serine/threonine-protein kinase Warts-like [Procambarus clarkii]XP_045614893.1 serine/threonine-protein kinase Warts-like [Procambarus clarkii]XP_045614894.1 serine/threonine-protein kinase Warts-like [Procambarus clarkii]XP_045614895.1 serine/threonine-pro